MTWWTAQLFYFSAGLGSATFCIGSIIWKLHIYAIHKFCRTYWEYCSVLRLSVCFIQLLKWWTDLLSTSDYGFARPSFDFYAPCMRDYDIVLDNPCADGKTDTYMASTVWGGTWWHFVLGYYTIYVQCNVTHTCGGSFVLHIVVYSRWRTSHRCLSRRWNFTKEVRFPCIQWVIGWCGEPKYLSLRMLLKIKIYTHLAHNTFCWALQELSLVQMQCLATTLCLTKSWSRINLWLLIKIYTHLVCLCNTDTGR